MSGDDLGGGKSRGGGRGGPRGGGARRLSGAGRQGKPKRQRQLYLGQVGEEAAVRQLELMGYTLAQRNYRCRLGEVDVIAHDGEVLCFVEVKARRTGAFGGGLEAVEGRKRGQVRRVAAYYLARFGDNLPRCRFDVVEVWLDAGGRAEKVHVVKNAF